MINDMDLDFVKTSVPHHTEIAKVLINASSTINAFDIEGSSITVDGIGTSKELGAFSTICRLSDHFMISSSSCSFQWSQPQHQCPHCRLSCIVFIVTVEQQMIEQPSLCLSSADSDLNVRLVLYHPS